MSELKVYYNPKCTKCRIAKEFLDEQNVHYHLFEYLDKTFTTSDIKQILKKGNLSVDDIIRKNEQEYKDYIKGKDLTDEQKIKLIMRYPKLLQRPIIISDKKATVARDKESLQSALLDMNTGNYR